MTIHSKLSVGAQSKRDRTMNLAAQKSEYMLYILLIFFEKAGNQNDKFKRAE